MDPRNFFAELKRRDVYKVAVTYASVAWFLIQAATLFPTFEAPAWAMMRQLRDATTDPKFDYFKRQLDQQMQAASAWVAFSGVER